MKKKLFRIAAIMAIAICVAMMAACGLGSKDGGKDKGKENDGGKPTASQNDSGKTDQGTTDPGETDKTGTEEPVTEPTPVKYHEVIKKISGASDKTGIYTIAITLSDKIGDAGIVEMVYYGAKGTPQENSVVNTFRIEYEKDDAGLYEVRTFFDGEVYQNYHRQTEIKVTNTFGANLRARNVTITYTPEGGKMIEIFKADAEEFYAE